MPAGYCSVDPQCQQWSTFFGLDTYFPVQGAGFKNSGGMTCGIKRYYIFFGRKCGLPAPTDDC